MRASNLSQSVRRLRLHGQEILVRTVLYKVSVEKTEGRRGFGRPRSGWEVYIKIGRKIKH